MILQRKLVAWWPLPLGVVLSCYLIAVSVQAHAQQDTATLDETLRLPQELIVAARDRIVPTMPAHEPPVALPGLKLEPSLEKAATDPITTPPIRVEREALADGEKWYLRSDFGRKLYTTFGGAKAREKIAAYDLSKGQFDEALRRLHDLRRRYPDTPESARAARLLAWVYVGLQDPEASLAFLLAAKDELASEDIEVLFQVGHAYLEEEEPFLAEHFLRQYRELSTARADQSAYLLGLARVQLGKWQEALKNFEEVITRHPFSPLKDEAQFCMAEAAYRLGSYSESERLWTTYLKGSGGTAPMADQAVYGLAFSRMAQDDKPGAAKHFARVFADFGQSPLRFEAKYFQATLQESSGDDDAARRTLFDLLQADPPEPFRQTISYAVALSLFRAGELPEAKLRFEELRARDPESALLPEIQYMLGTITYNLHQPAAAAELFAAMPATARPERVAAARLRAGHSWFRAGRMEDAAREYAAAMASDSASIDRSEATYWAGYAAMIAGKTDEAVRHLEAILPDSSDPNRHLQTVLDLAYCYSTLVRDVDARNLLSELTHSESVSPRVRAEALVMTGIAETNLRNFSAGGEALRLAQELAPAERSAQEASFRLGQLYLSQEELSKAESTLKQYLDTYGSGPWAADAMYLLGMARFRKPDYEAAAATFLELSMDHAASPLALSAMLKRGDCFYNLEQYDRAVETYRQVVELYPDRPEAAEAHYAIGLARNRQGDIASFAAETETFLSAHADSPLAPAILFLLAEEHRKAGRIPEAQQAYERLLREYGASETADNAQYELALTYLATKDVNRAIAALWEVARRPGSELAAAALLNIGQASAEVGDRAGAVDAYRRLLGDHATSTSADQATLSLALLLGEEGKPSEALNLLADFVDRYPDSTLRPKVDLERAKLLLADEEHGPAELLLAQVVESKDTQAAPEAQFYLGEIRYREGKWEDAVAEYMKVPYLHGYAPEWANRARYQAALCYISEGKRKEARTLLESTLAASQDTELQQQISDKLRELATPVSAEQ
ncbi:MAG: tetratricopeptide repeat protein [Candidatus Schekmanbacteria bacterium]|nr:tetratricopeptide repeat protein [Candidatus Schekmanbacteria bacterium]